MRMKRGKKIILGWGMFVIIAMIALAQNVIAASIALYDASSGSRSGNILEEFMRLTLFQALETVDLTKISVNLTPYDEEADSNPIQIQYRIYNSDLSIDSNGYSIGSFVDGIDNPIYDETIDFVDNGTADYDVVLASPVRLSAGQYYILSISRPAGSRELELLDFFNHEEGVPPDPADYYTTDPAYFSIIDGGVKRSYEEFLDWTVIGIRPFSVDADIVSVEDTYTLSASVTGDHGTISPTSGTYSRGRAVVLTATPESGYRVRTWTGTDNDVLTTETNTVTMDSDRTVTVEFELIPTYLLSTEIEGSGTIDLSPSDGTYVEGTSVQATAQAAEGWEFDHWSGDVSLSDIYNSIVTIIMDAVKSIIAVFEEIVYTLTASVVSGHGTIDPESGSYSQGEVVNLTATPDSGYRVRAWAGTDNDSTTATSNSVVMDSNRTVTVEFEQIPVTTYSLTASVINGHGIIEPETGSYNQGEVVTITATPESDYRVKAWVGTDDDSTTATSNTVVMDSDRTVTVEFESIPETTYVLSISTEGEGTVDVDPTVSNMVYTAGTVVTLTAHPEQGWELIQWEGNVDNPGKTITTTIRMDRDQTVIADFAHISQSEEEDSSDGGSGGLCFMASSTEKHAATGIPFIVCMSLLVLVGSAYMSKTNRVD